MADRFHEMVIDAPLPVVKAFLAGVFLEREPAGKLWFSREAGIERQTLGERLKEFFGGHGDITHMVMAEGAARVVREALVKARERLGFGLVSDQLIEEADFDFSFTAYARSYADEIREVLADLPPDVRLEDYTPKEEIDPRAEGVEAYTPAHDYTYCGKGKAVGDLEGVVDLHGRLSRLSLVKTGGVNLTLA